MRTEYRVFIPLVLFFTLMTPVYGFSTHWREPIGVVALALTLLLVAMMMGYFYILSRNMRLRPDDDPKAEVADGAGELGFFPAHSIWPLAIALTLVLIVLGPVFGWWLTILGFGVGIWSLSGWVYEFYRGEFAH